MSAERRKRILDLIDYECAPPTSMEAAVEYLTELADEIESRKNAIEEDLEARNNDD